MHSQSGYRKSHRKGSDGSGSQRGAGQEEGSSAGTYPLQLPPFEPRTGTYAMHTAGQASGASNMDRYGSAEYDSDGAYANVGQSRAWKSYALANVGSNQYEGPGVWPNYDSPPNGASASSSSVPENSKPAGRQAGHEKAKPAARPRYNRNDSGSWSNLLKGAGYESAANASSTNLAHDGDVHDGKGVSLLLQSSASGTSYMASKTSRSDLGAFNMGKKRPVLLLDPLELLQSRLQHLPCGSLCCRARLAAVNLRELSTPKELVSSEGEMLSRQRRLLSQEKVFQSLLYPSPLTV